MTETVQYLRRLDKLNRKYERKTRYTHLSDQELVSFIQNGEGKDIWTEHCWVSDDPEYLFEIKFYQKPDLGSCSHIIDGLHCTILFDPETVCFWLRRTGLEKPSPCRLCGGGDDVEDIDWSSDLCSKCNKRLYSYIKRLLRNVYFKTDREIWPHLEDIAELSWLATEVQKIARGVGKDDR